MVVGVADDAIHVAGVEVAVEENKGLSGLGELESAVLR